MKPKGIVLIAVIILILFVSIAVLGANTFIVQRLVGVDVEQRTMRSRYNAQAGLNYALYQYRATNSTFSGNISIDGNNSARVTTSSGGTAATSLRIDATGSSFGGGGRNLLGITLTNTGSSTITLDQMTLYLASGSETLDDTIINGVTVWTIDTAIGTSPVTVNITNVNISAGATINLNRIRFTNSASDKTIFLRFIMTDGSTTSTCTVAPPPASVCTTTGTSLSISCTGVTTGSNTYRTINATYNTTSGRITDLDEVSSVVP